LEGIKSHIDPHFTMVEHQKWDYREPVPNNLANRFDTIIVDPPYSIAGLKLVLSRSLSLLKNFPGKEIYLSFAHRSPKETLKIQKEIFRMGIVIQEIIPRFNYYEGAGILGNSTQLYRLITTGGSKPIIQANEMMNTPIYTGEINQSLRFYYCSNCSKLIEVGKKQHFHTIEQLKSSGCPFCSEKGPFLLDHKEEVEK
jgi:N4-bis(aminopropyl)spermidine synthase